MIYNYFKIAFRNILRNKLYTTINIIGLAVSLASALVILLYVRDEISYDRFAANGDRVYRIAVMNDNPQTRSPHPLAQELVKLLPEVESAVSLSPIWGPGLTRPSFSLRYGDIRFDEREILSVDSTFLRVFPFRLIAGDPNIALKKVGGIVLTKAVAQKYFGSDNPIGKTLKMNEAMDLEVTGIVENVPHNAHFHFDFLISYTTLKAHNPDDSFYEWGDFGHYNYIMLKPGSDPLKVEDVINKWVIHSFPGFTESRRREYQNRKLFTLQPIQKIHLHSQLRWELEPNGTIVTLYIFVSIAFCMVLVACSNFINLQTARGLKRSKEIGIRKSLGAFRKTIVIQFLGEASLIVFFALIVALGIVEIVMPTFRGLTGKPLYSTDLFALELIPYLLGLLMLVILVAGGYTSFFLSRVSVVAALKDFSRLMNKKSALRQTLVVGQFVVSIALCIAIGVVWMQIRYLQNYPLGFKKEGLITVPIRSASMRNSYQAVKNELQQHPAIVYASAISNTMGGNCDQHPVRIPGSTIQGEPTMDMLDLYVDHDFVKTMGLTIAHGRGFSGKILQSDTVQQNNEFLLNQTAAMALGEGDPVGKQLDWIAADDTVHGTIVGVVTNFHNQSLHRSIEPVLMRIQPEEFNYMIVRVDERHLQSAIEHIERVWKKFDPKHTFHYTVTETSLARLYASEEIIRNVLGIFTGLAIFVSCLGLFGLAAFTAEQRTKEIGIRKVLGASIMSIISLLSKDFLQLVLIAACIASPLGWYATNQWLQGFAYRTEIPWWIFLIACVLAIIIALTTVAGQSFRAARANPVESLRSE